MAKLESLIVDIQANTAELQKGLDEANRRLEGFDKSLKDLAGVVVFEKFAKMAAQAVAAVAQFALQGAEATDRMGKLAQAAGVTVESFSRLAYAGELSGVSAEEMGSALVKLDNNLAKAATGAKEQSAIFSALGVKVTDSSGKIRSADAVMGDLADRFAGMTDGAAKTKLAIEVLGKAGAEMIPLFNGGREGLAALSAEADKFGITVTSGAAASAEAFNDNLAKLKLAATAVGQNVAAQLTPAFTVLTDELLNSGEGAEFLKDAAFILAGTLKVLASAGVIIAAIFEATGKTIARVASAVMNAAQGNFKEARDDLVGQFTDVIAVASKAGERIEKMWKSGEAPAKAARQAHGKTAEQIIADAEAMKKASTEAETAFKALEKVALGYEAQVAGFGGDAFSELQGKLEKGELAEQLEKIGDKAAAMRDRILSAAKALKDLKNAKLVSELNFGLARDSANTSRQIQDRQTQFAQVGMSNTERARAGTAGFSDFNDALSKLAVETNANAELLAAAEFAKAQGDQAGAQAALMAADEHKRAAEIAGRAADSFEELAKENLARQKEIASMAIGVISSVGESGAEIGKLINSAMQGFQAGGVWGAIIAVAANLFAKLESAGRFIDTAFANFMEVFSQLDDSFGILFDSLTSSLVPAMKILGVAFKAVNDVLVPVFQTLEAIRQPFADLASGFMDLLEETGILGFMVKALSAVFGTVNLVINGIVLGLQYAWGAVLKVVRGVIALFTAGQGTKEIDETIKKHDEAIKATQEAIARTADSIGKDRASPGSSEISTTGDVTAMGDVNVDTLEMTPFDLSRYGFGGGNMDVIDVGGWGYAAGSVAGAEAARALVEQMALINGASVEAAAALGQAAYNDFLALGTAANSAAQSLDSFSQSLTNVPAGFRYAAAAFNAQDVGGAAPVMSSGGGGGDTIMVTVQGNVWRTEELAEAIAQITEEKKFRKGGSPL